MELNGITGPANKGQDNTAFEGEAPYQGFLHQNTSEEQQNEAKNTAEHNKGFLEQKLEAFREFLEEHKNLIRLIIYLVLAAGFVAIVITACVLNFRRALTLLLLSLIVLFFLVWDWAVERFGSSAWDKLLPVREFLRRNWVWMRWVAYSLVLLAVILWLALDTAKRGKRQFMSFFGLIALTFFMMLISTHPFHWRWRTVVWGIGLQVILGLLILRTTIGYAVVKWLGEKVELFMSFTDVGSKFVFGESYEDHFFVFKAMPILIFISSCISILHHIGFMNWIIHKVGFIMQITMATSPAESLVAAANAFLGQMESLILVRPYFSKLTKSEIHAVLTTGFAGISGTVMGIYIFFGVDSAHLLTASVMSGPSSLVVAKLVWPETETPIVTAEQDFNVDRGRNSNILEAAVDGANSALTLAANIISNIISFLALLTLADALLSWLGGLLNYPQLDFTMICSHLFMPLAFLMGVSWEDSLKVGELIGVKTFTNEFVAYQRLAQMIKLRKAGGPEYVDNVKQYISVHSETIATYALCGFANFASLGIAMGGAVALAPNRRADISRCAIRALISGSISTFMNACIAGILYIPPIVCQDVLLTPFNTTVVSNATLAGCCTELYNSVTVFEPWNVTIQGGFNVSSLRGCCEASPATHFNCSLWL